MPSRSNEFRIDAQCPDAIPAWVRTQRLLIAIGVAPFLLIALAFAPAPEAGASTIAGIPSLCIFRAWTGIPCPGCGITRSLVCCAHGHFAAAMTFHPLGPAVFAGLIGASLQRLPLFRRLTLSQSVITISGFTGIALIFGIWLARLAGLLPLP